MAANSNAYKISGNYNIEKIMERYVDKVSANHHADKILQKLREAKNADNTQTKVSENQKSKTSGNQNMMNSEKTKNVTEIHNTCHSETQNISEIPTLKSILDRKKVHKVKAKKLKELLSNEKEYYPNKRRRKMCLKKVVLHPKHEYRIIAATNKRKRTIPVKEVEPPPHPIAQKEQSPEPELTLRDLVRVTDEQGLDEEDFMEILTCPSPVWWESDEEEDFSFKLQDIDADISQDQNMLIQEIDQKTRIDDNGNKIREETTNKTRSNTSLTNKIVSKRNKLEKLLNNIKIKSLTTVGKNNEVQELKNNELIKNDDCYELRIKEQIEPKNDYNEDTYCDQAEVIDELNSDGKVRKISISGLSDVSISDELLNTLEDIKIPVKESNEMTFQNEKEEKGTGEKEVENYVALIVNKEPVKRRKRGANSEISVVNNYEFLRKRTRKPNRKYEFDWSPEKKKSKSESPKNETVTKTSDGMLNSKTKTKEKGKLTTDRVKAEEVYKKYVKNINLHDKRKLKDISVDLPPLTKNPLKMKPRVYASPKSLEILDSSTTEPDSIPDTNIKFLDEYSEKTNEEVNVNKYAKGKDGDLVTVYQIVTNNPENLDDIESQIKVNLVNKSLQSDTKSNTQINEFYKTRKRIKKT